MNLRWRLAILLICGVCCTSLYAQPANNNCASASPVFMGDNPNTNIGATADGGPLVGCAAFTTTNLNVWYTFTVPATATYLLSTCGPGVWDSRLVIYPAAAPCGSTTVLACNDDQSGCQSFGSQITIALTAGDTHLIECGGFGAATVGAGTLSIINTAPANNDCAAATVLATGVAQSWSNYLATQDAGVPAFICGSATAGTHLDVWFTWTAPAAGNVVWDTSITLPPPTTTSTVHDVRMELYLGACGALGPVVECDDQDGISSSAIIQRSVLAGEVYLIRLAGNSALAMVASGRIAVSYIDNFLTGVTVSNNACASALPLATGVPTVFSTLLATNDGPNPACGAGTVPRDIWYTWMAPATGFGNVATCAASPYNNLNTRVTVYPAGCPAILGTALACSDNSCGRQDSATFVVGIGVTYLIQISLSTSIASSSADAGIGTVVTAMVPPPGDECLTAIPAVVGANLFDTSLGYTLSPEPAGPCTAGFALSPDVWYSYTPACTSTVRFETCGSVGLGGDTILHIYAGCGGPLVGCADDSFPIGCAGFESLIDLPVTGATNYRIRVSGWGGGVGAGVLNIRQLGNNCADALTAVDGANPWANTEATTDGPTASCASIGRDVWFRYFASCTGDLTINTLGTVAPGDTVLVVYNGAAACPPLPTDELPLACSDDAIGLLSQVLLSVTTGQNLLIRVGSFGTGAGGCTGNLNISCLGVLAPTGLTCSLVTVGGGDVTLAWTDGQLYDIVNVYVDAILHSTVTSTGGLNGTTLVGLSTFASHTICVEGQVGVMPSNQACCTLSFPGDGTGLEIIVDGDGGGAINSTAALNAALIANGLLPIIVPNLDAFVGTPARVWHLNGSFGGGNHVLTVAEGMRLSDFVIAGGHVYLEGGDVFGFDPTTPFDSYNGLDDSVPNDGNDTFTNMTGLDFSAAILSGLSSPYLQDITVGNDWTDQYIAGALDLAGPSSGVIWQNGPDGVEPAYATGVYYNTNAGFGKVLVQSWEFGGHSSQVALAAAYIAALQATPPPAAISGLSCSYAAGSASATWTNNGTYDEIRVYVDGLLDQTLGGGATSASVVTASAIQLCIEPFTLRGGAGAQVCCDIGRPPTAVIDLACVLGVGGANVSWTNTSTYDSINVYVDAILAQTLPGTATTAFVATVVDIEICIEPVTLTGGAGAQTCCDFIALVDFIRGEANDDGMVDIADAVFTLDYLFAFGPVPNCLDAADSNDSGDVDLADAVYTLDYLFQQMPAPPAPGPTTCGVDPTTGDIVGCALYNNCP